MKIYYCTCILLLYLIKGSHPNIFRYTNPAFTLYSVLCGCFGANETAHTLYCPKEEVIRLEFDDEPMYYKTIGTGDTCPDTDLVSCANLREDLSTLPYSHRLALYRNCSSKNSCTIQDPGLLGSTRYLHYVFQCINENVLLNISNSIRIANPATEQTPSVFYFSGADHTGTQISCECTATSTGDSRLEIFFINMGAESCGRIQIIYNQEQVLNCGDQRLIIGSEKATKTLYMKSTDMDLQIKILNSRPVGDEILYFRIVGTDTKIHCSGCSQVQESTTNNYRPNYTGTTTISDESGGEVDSIKELYFYITLGLLVAIILCNILVVAIYCILRRRKKTKRPVETSSEPALQCHHMTTTTSTDDVIYDLPTNSDTYLRVY